MFEVARAYRGNRWRIVSGPALAVALGWAVPAAASLPDRLCSKDSAAGAQFSTPDSLAQLAGSTEAMLARAAGSAQAGDAALAGLESPAAGSATATPQSLAAYCLAAGEAMRLARGGSQYQARRYLISAFQRADAAGAGELGARAAYRLGLVAVGGATSGSRGASRDDPGAKDVAKAVSAPPQIDEGTAACDALSGSAQSGLTSQQVTVLALQCSSKQAFAAGDFLLSARANLRLARFCLAFAESWPASADQLRLTAQTTALAGIVTAQRIAAAPARAELLGRLIEAALDAGAPGIAPGIAAGLPAMRVAGAGDPALEAFASALSGRIALAQGDSAGARAAFERAIFLESQRSQPLRQSDWLLLLADADPAQRTRHVAAAYRALQSVRSLLPSVDPLTEESNFALHMRRVFEAAVDVQLTEATSGDEGGRIASAQEIIEAYRQAELQSLFGNECVPARDPIKPAELRPGEVLLYPILLPDRVELLYAAGDDVSASGGVRYHRLTPDLTANRRSVDALVDDLVLSASYGGDSNWRQPARTLYDILIKPIEGRLGTGKTLVIVPDGALRALPFATLLAGDGSYLVQKTRISIAPSLSYSQPGIDRHGVHPEIVAASLQREVDLPAGIFPKLNGTAQEARVAAGLDPVTPRPGRFIPDFHKADLVRALSEGRVDVLHLATHASFNGRSDRSFIVANGEAIPLADLRGLIARNRARGDELDLLVLSACETAVGDDEASMGLAGAAVQAGARSAVASLWEVNDAGTVALMRAFYAAYRNGESKAASLRDAQLALIAHGGAQADPSIWAAFTLLGGWR